MVFIVILAGGGGERLWPKSRKNRPKQCLFLDGKQSLIQGTYEIAVEIAGNDNILIATCKEIAPAIKDQLPQVRMIVEPLARDSAAGMGFACAHLLQENRDEATLFMGADYFIQDINRFKEVIAAAAHLAELGKITTIGIKPNRIETRFGYINPGKPIPQTSVASYEVEGFTEKPDVTSAQKFIEKGYLWNSGMFIVKPSVLYQNIQKYMPTLYQALEMIQKADFEEEVAQKAFASLPKISIDYGVMEKTTDLVVVKGDFQWDDIGTWDSLELILKPDSKGNIVQGEFFGVDVQNSVIFGEKPIIAYGISNLVLIESDDCIFISHRNKAKDVKKILTELEKSATLKRLVVY